MKANEAQDMPSDLENVYAQTYADLLAWCERHVPRELDAHDIAQEAFARFSSVQARGLSLEDVNVLPYLITTAKHLIADHFRAQKAQVTSLDFDVADTSQDVWQQAEHSMFGSALEALPADCQQVLRARYDEGLKVSTIADSMGVSRFSVRRRINRALHVLQHELERRGW